MKIIIEHRYITETLQPGDRVHQGLYVREQQVGLVYQMINGTWYATNLFNYESATFSSERVAKAWLGIQIRLHYEALIRNERAKEPPPR